MDQFLTPEQVAEKLGVKLSTIYNWTHIGYIPHTKLGRLIRFQEVTLQKWTEGLAVKGRTSRTPRVL
jgi:excisionase family DNA binding protein